MCKLIKRTGLLIAAPFLIILIYLFAALVGGLVPSNIASPMAGSLPLTKPVYLTSNALHADIAIPVDDEVRERFAFLRQDGFPLDYPKLEYLIVGWGSQEFYTSTANYSDMKFATIWRAATGDASVMHVAPGGDISNSEGAVEVSMTQEGFEKMLGFIMNSFEQSQSKPELVEDATFGYGDLFYKTRGRFNIFNPCNIWVSKALNKAGVSTGIWTPTTYSLLLHHRLYN